MNELMAKHCNRPFEDLVRDTERDNYMSAEEAMNYGLIDKVITKLEKKTNNDDI